LLRAAAGKPVADSDHVRTGRRKNGSAEWEVPWLSGIRRIEAGAHRQCRVRPVTDRRLWRGDGCVGTTRVSAAFNFWQRHGISSAVLVSHLEKIWSFPGRGHLGSARRAPAFHLFESDGMGRFRFARSRVSRFFRARRAARSLAQHARAQISRGGSARRRFNPALGAFRPGLWIAALGCKRASHPRGRFSLPPGDARVRCTVEAIERKLVKDGFVLRYDTAATQDGLPPGEGAFLACSFWLADAYVLLGRGEDARKLFERLLSLRNDSGPCSRKSMIPPAKRLLGNFSAGLLPYRAS